MIDALILQCAVVDAPPAVIRQIIQVESAGNPLAININSNTPFDLSSINDIKSAAKLAEKYIQEGYTVDIGYMQVNSTHLETFGFSVTDILEPCANIAIGSQIFMKAYGATKAFYGETDLALQSALSAYNTGTFHRGFNNGYVTRYAAPAPTKLPTKIVEPSKDTESVEYRARRSQMSLQLDFSLPTKKGEATSMTTPDE